MIADATGLPCVTLEADEGPAYGAALLAGVGLGIWNSVEEACAQTVRLRHRIEPRAVDYGAAYQRYRELGRR
jgi:xylulokinase